MGRREDQQAFDDFISVDLLACAQADVSIKRLSNECLERLGIVVFVPGLLCLVYELFDHCALRKGGCECGGC